MSTLKGEAPQSLSLTSDQQRAVETIDRSVIVSASAGSGKTTVLAQRCAYLVCDAPPAWRCDVDRLLVLTFTEAAAAQMRSRIAEAVRSRLRARPTDPTMRRQIALLDVAQISTIHSFCLWMVRRWFADLGIDPSAAVIDEDESFLLRRETLDALFSRLYADGNAEQDHSETDRSDAADPPAARLARGFLELVDVYGLGSDRDVGELVLRIARFVESLPDPQAWLSRAVDAVSSRRERTLLALIDEFGHELSAQAGYCDKLHRQLLEDDPAGHFFARKIQEHGQRLDAWAKALGTPHVLRCAAIHDPSDFLAEAERDRETQPVLAAYEGVRREIAEHNFDKATGPRLPADASETARAARTRSGQAWSRVRDELFKKRIRSRFCLFARDEWLEGMSRTAPYVTTIAELVRAFLAAIRERKQSLGVLEFCDLERFAYDLVKPGHGATISDATARLRERFRYVLVDEFQDINPLQQAIIESVSREQEPGARGNVFVVGDVKQSIYRFRLAEPFVFVKRLTAARSAERAGQALFLQTNFRSRPVILEAVNLLFRTIMSAGTGPIAYDEHADLKAPVEPAPTDGEGPLPDGRLPVRVRTQTGGSDGAGGQVELHLLDRELDLKEHEWAEAGSLVSQSAAAWSQIEREAFLIGTRIQELRRDSQREGLDDPLRYRDMVVLLRSTKFQAQRVAGMLAAMGIPSYADVGGQLFASLEVRDVSAALQIFDNPRQDIPLAAVLRNGILGLRLSEDELVAIRCIHRAVPFHEAFFQYPRLGADAVLRERVQTLLARIERYRTEARRRPVAEVIWSLYNRQGYLTYVAGLPRGDQRQANLLKLHELARRFATFRRQGLHRFLRFIEALQDRDQDVGSASALGEAEDVVRVMSIHQSKGLEFPVVFVAGLGNKFNLGDRSGSMIFERRSGMGLRVLDPQRMLAYPSAPHVLAALEVERTTREEEARILYVACTRAREKLILIGSIRGACDQAEALQRHAAPLAPTAYELRSAASSLDWILAALAAVPGGAVRFDGETTNQDGVFRVHAYDGSRIGTWKFDSLDETSLREARLAVSRGDPLPPAEPLESAGHQVDSLAARIAYEYPWLSVTSVPAVVAASEFKGTFDYLYASEERPADASVAADFSIPPSRYADGDGRHPLQKGLATHRVLQHLDFERAIDHGLASELRRLEQAGILNVQEREALNVKGLAWFLETPLALRIRESGERYRREVPFIAKEPVRLFDATVQAAEHDVVLVRGIMDGILVEPDGLTLIDFKTDAIAPAQVMAHAERYRAQVTLYARAAVHLWKRPVSQACLVFLDPRQIVTWTAPTDAFDFEAQRSGKAHV